MSFARTKSLATRSFLCYGVEVRGVSKATAQVTRFLHQRCIKTPPLNRGGFLYTLEDFETVSGYSITLFPTTCDEPDRGLRRVESPFRHLVIDYYPDNPQSSI